jgi:hypothetical protein
MRIHPAFAAALVACACSHPRSDSSSDPSSEPAPNDAQLMEAAVLRGLFSATSSGAIGDLALLDDGGYVLRPSSCAARECLDVGRATYDANARTLSLAPDRQAATKTLHVDEPRIEEGSVREATIDGQLVGLVAGDAALSTPRGSEEVVVYPLGNAVQVARSDDAAFIGEEMFSQRWVDKAYLYSSHGMPGKLFGGIAEDELRRFLADSTKRLIVAACFAGAPLVGGSTIRRLVATYASDPRMKSRVYGCTGFTFGDWEKGYECSGAWVDGNGKPVTLDERKKLALIQGNCERTTIDANGKPIFVLCHE